MNTISSIVLCAIFSWTLPSPEMTADGWVALFDGETMFGWTSSEPGMWTVEENLLTGCGPAKLTSTTSFKNVQIQYEVRCALCDAWETKTLEITDGPVVLEVPDGAGWSFRNILMKPEKMTSLFNGSDLAGWNTYPEMLGKFSANAEKQRIEAKNGLGMLETCDSFGDFVFQSAVSLQPNVNSGFFFRCIPGENLNGYECQLNNTLKDGDRTQPADSGSGAIFRRTVARYVPATDPELFYVTIIARGPHIATWINGLQITDWNDERKPNPNPRRGQRVEPGTIMIQAHDATTDCFFQNLKISSWD